MKTRYRTVEVPLTFQRYMTRLLCHNRLPRGHTIRLVDDEHVEQVRHEQEHVLLDGGVEVEQVLQGQEAGGPGKELGAERLHQLQVVDAVTEADGAAPANICNHS